LKITPSREKRKVGTLTVSVKVRYITRHTGSQRRSAGKKRVKHENIYCAGRTPVPERVLPSLHFASPSAKRKGKPSEVVCEELERRENRLDTRDTGRRKKGNRTY